MYFSWGTTWCSSLSSMFKSAQVILSSVGHTERRDAPACLSNKYQTLVFAGLGSTWCSPINCVILAKALFLSGVIIFFFSQSGPMGGHVGQPLKEALHL